MLGLNIGVKEGGTDNSFLKDEYYLIHLSLIILYILYLFAVHTCCPISILSLLHLTRDQLFTYLLMCRHGDAVEVA